MTKSEESHWNFCLDVGAVQSAMDAPFGMISEIYSMSTPAARIANTYPKPRPSRKHEAVVKSFTTL